MNLTLEVAVTLALAREATKQTRGMVFAIPL
jgi:hypothetical protein